MDVKNLLPSAGSCTRSISDNANGVLDAMLRLVWEVPKRQPGAPAVFDFFLTFLVCDEESDYQALTIDGGDHRNPANFIIRRFANIGTLEHTINRQALLDQTRMSTDPLTVLSLHSCTHRFPSVRLYQSHPAEAPLTQ